ncbi:hypothetical protein AU461_23295 [Vibrio parahaemolyticus]|uniref:hypothetical protein n=1 Tax=Vibrio parahaemolyticus TaxID=670 RepID=UPI000789AB3D|nr:hypothetical protein [Vibrio parahaemolyticus]KYO58445.1 hypothetical protein AU461_23295 [Vibrio parahaemolyticus]KYX47721.1 hypothetical protein AU389_01950 [Vibrio parahaemolyticus]
MIPIDMSWFEYKLANGDISMVSEDGLYKVSSSDAATSKYLIHTHPTKLKVGTVIKATCEVRFISGNAPRLSVEFHSDVAHSQNKVVTYFDEISEDHGDDWQKLETVAVVPDGGCYARCILGHFSDSDYKQSQFEFRNPQLHLSAGINTAIYTLQEPVTYSRAFSGDAISNNLHAQTTGSGTVTELNGSFICAADGKDSAYLVLDYFFTDKAVYQPDAKFARIQVLAKKLAGHPTIAIEARSSDGFNGRDIEITSKNFEWHDFVVGLPENTDVVRFVTGVTTSRAGSCEVRAVKVSVFGSTICDRVTPFLAMLKKDSSGQWVLDSGPGRFGVVNLYNLTVTSTDLRLDGNFANIRPVMNVEVMSYASGEKYKATIESVIDRELVVKIFDVNSPTIALNPNDVADLTAIQIIGFSSV